MREWLHQLEKLANPRMRGAAAAHGKQSVPSSHLPGCFCPECANYTAQQVRPSLVPPPTPSAQRHHGYDGHQPQFS